MESLRQQANKYQGTILNFLLIITEVNGFLIRGNGRVDDIDTQTTVGHRYIYYTPINDSKLGDEKYVHHGLGTGAKNGCWQTFYRDLQADLNEAQPGVTITEINGFLIRGNGRVDDIELMSEMPAPNIAPNITIVEPDGINDTLNGVCRIE